MRRMYVSTADFRAPFDPVDFQGLGDVSTRWPTVRTYWSTANFRAPYDNKYFQDNTLLGVPTDLNPSVNAPSLVRRYVVSGEPVPSTLRDAMVPLNQVNRWVYVGLGVVSLVGAYRSYRKWQKERGATAPAPTSTSG